MVSKSFVLLVFCGFLPMLLACSNMESGEHYRGYIVEIREENGLLEQLVLQTTDQHFYTFPVSNGMTFRDILPHLRIHQKEGIPVTLELKTRGDAKVVVAILD
jgi:hypothetical protein